MFCCFTHEGVCTQVTTQVTLMGGLIWLRHTRARMGHQVVASPTVRYILHGGRNRSVAVNSLSLIEIWETCTLLLTHRASYSTRERPSLGEDSRTHESLACTNSSQLIRLTARLAQRIATSSDASLASKPRTGSCPLCVSLLCALTLAPPVANLTLFRTCTPRSERNTGQYCITCVLVCLVRTLQQGPSQVSVAIRQPWRSCCHRQ